MNFLSSIDGETYMVNSLIEDLAETTVFNYGYVIPFKDDIDFSSISFGYGFHIKICLRPEHMKYFMECFSNNLDAWGLCREEENDDKFLEIIEND